MFELKCVCTQPSYNDKIHPVLFKYPDPFLISSRSLLTAWRSFCTGPSHDCWLTLVFSIDTPWGELSSVSHSFTLEQKRLRCFVVGCNNEHGMHHLLPTSAPLKTQRITFVFEGNAPADLPKGIYVWQIIHDPVSPTQEVSIRYFYESLQTAFPNNVLVSKFHDECS